MTSTEGTTYHIESHDISERNGTGSVALHEDFVDDFRAAAGRKSEHEGSILGWLEFVDTVWEYVSNELVCIRRGDKDIQMM